MTDVEPSYSRIPLKLALLGLGGFVVGTNAFVIAGLLPDIAATLGAHTSDVSYSISFYSIIVAVTAPAVAILLPRVSRTTLIAVGLVLIAAGTVLAAIATSLEVFTAGRVIAALGGAALMPTATAAAAAIVPPERRGRALAIVAFGLTASTAVGSPLGTALGDVGGWELPLLIVAALALLLAIAVAAFLRDIPLGRPATFADRLAPLRDGRVLLALVTSVLVVAGFNVVYIFSSAVTEQATGGSGALLAGLLLGYGVAGILGNAITGPLTDRLGSRVSGTAFMAAQAAVLLALPLVAQSYLGTALLFVLWGVTAFGAVVPVQHRLVAIDPATSGLALSWFTTAMYLGIAISPPLGAASTALGGAELIPVAGAIAILIGLGAFQLSHRRSRRAETELVPVTDALT